MPRACLPALLPCGTTTATLGSVPVEYVRPKALGEALEALAAFDDPTPLAGGTDLMVEINLAHRRPTAVVSLRDVEELTRWEEHWIGAGVTFARMEQASDTALAELSRTVGSPQIRAAATLGGNLGTASPAGDGLPFLAACDAHIVLRSATGSRRLRWDEFLTGPKQTARRPDELIVGVELAPRPERQAFAKVGVRQAMVISAVSCCVLRGSSGETRVALGSVGPTVLRVPRAEEVASHAARLTSSDLDEFQRRVAEEVRPITDHRASAEYRRHAAGVIARRALERCLQ